MYTKVSKAHKKERILVVSAQNVVFDPVKSKLSNIVVYFPRALVDKSKYLTVRSPYTNYIVINVFIVALCLFLNE